jgi:hypothetical protein
MKFNGHWTNLNDLAHYFLAWHVHARPHFVTIACHYNIYLLTFFNIKVHYIITVSEYTGRVVRDFNSVVEAFQEVAEMKKLYKLNIFSLFSLFIQFFFSFVFKKN